MGPYFAVPRLAQIPWIVHGFGGAGWREADFPAFASSQGFRPVIMRQLHSDTIHRLDRAPDHRLEGDALITRAPGLLLVIRTADCLPVFLADEASRVVAAVHCGWRGTRRGILEKAVEAMARDFGSEPAGVLAALGPCIGSACYEVGAEVHADYIGAGFPADVFASPPGRPGKFLLDLRAANLWLLGRAGIKPENTLSAGGACSHCDAGFFSYRRDPGEARRMVNFIGIRP